MVSSLKSGVTRTEVLTLLGVLAVLSLLVMPSCRSIFPDSMARVCLRNQKALTEAWTLYADDNEGLLVFAHVEDPEWCSRAANAWAGCPQDRMGRCVRENPTLEQKAAGIRAGAMYPYVGPQWDQGGVAMMLYHCPADAGPAPGAVPRLRSYSMSSGMNGLPLGAVHPYTRTETIRRPAEKYVFVEHADPIGWNRHSWRMDPDPVTQYWTTPVAVRHGRASTLSYADGHAELHRWAEKETLAFGPQPEHNWIHLHPGSRDLEYMKDHFGCLTKQALADLGSLGDDPR